jgi:hypothetical protein
MSPFRFAFLSSIFGVVAVSATPLGTNITIPDGNVISYVNTLTPYTPVWNYYNNGWYGNHEDNEIEYPAQIGQEWDLEGMYMQDTTLSLVGGYNFRAGVFARNHTYASGDLFIDIDGNARYGTSANSGSGTGGTVVDNFGYDYVVHFNAGLTAYSVFDIHSGSITVARATDVAGSNPWRYVSGGVALQGWQDVTALSFGALGAGDVSALGLLGTTTNNSHYSLSLDLSFLPGSRLTTFHYTMECGNDDLIGRTTTNAVPDAGATFGLMIAGLMLVGSGRFMRSSRGRSN